MQDHQLIKQQDPSVLGDQSIESDWVQPSRVKELASCYQDKAKDFEEAVAKTGQTESDLLRDSLHVRSHRLSYLLETAPFNSIGA